MYIYKYHFSLFVYFRLKGDGDYESPNDEMKQVEDEEGSGEGNGDGRLQDGENSDGRKELLDGDVLDGSNRTTVAAADDNVCTVRTKQNNKF